MRILQTFLDASFSHEPTEPLVVTETGALHEVRSLRGNEAVSALRFEGAAPDVGGILDREAVPGRRLALLAAGGPLVVVEEDPLAPAPARIKTGVGNVEIPQGSTAWLVSDDKGRRWSLASGAGGGPGGGESGPFVLSGTTAPDNGDGEDDDLYFRTTTGDVYKKIAGAWSLVANLVGPEGPEGDAGAPGADGADGAPGADGADGAGFAPVAAHLTADTSLTSAPTFTDLATINATGTAFLIKAHAAGISAGLTTMQLRVMIDGTASDHHGTYSTSVENSSRALGADLVFLVSGLSSGSHTIKLQAAYGGASIAINAAANPKLEGAWLLVTPTAGAPSAAYDVFASRPAAGAAGRRFIASDGGPDWVDTGSAWRPIVQGILGYQPRPASDFTVRSHGGIATTLADYKGGLKMVFANSANAGEEVRIASRAAPSTPYRVEAHLRLLWSSRGTLLSGLGFRDSATGTVELFCAQADTTTTPKLARHRATASNTGTSPTYSFNAELVETWSIGMGDQVWLAITRDGSGNRGFEWSPDGEHWTVISELAVATNGFFTPDEILLTSWVSFGVNGDNQGAIFDSYREA